MDLPPPPLVLERRVEFSQTDAAGIMHFSTYFIFMEAAEAALFRKLGHPLIWNHEGCFAGFPRVDCQCRFRKPLHFDEVVRIRLTLTDIESGRIHYGFTFTDGDDRTCARGKLVTTCAIRPEDGSMKALPIPDSLLESLKNWKNSAG